MRRVILKAGEHEVRPLPFGAPPDQDAPPAEPDLPDARLQALQRALEECEARLVLHEKAAKEAFEQGRREGGEAASQARQRAQDEALKMLEYGIETANADYRSALQQFESLAFEAASAALKALVGAEDRYRDLLASALAHIWQDLGTRHRLSLTVSSDDFPDPTQLESLARRLGVDSALVAATSALKKGDCRFALTMGSAQFSFEETLAAVSEVLQSSASSGVSG